jgi:hypothetical protein
MREASAASGGQAVHRLGAGVLRSNLANEEFIKWLPETMVRFVVEQNLPSFPIPLEF